MKTKNIQSLLIANRGEIAIRIARTAKQMGIKTFGIYTSKEPNALYLKTMDEVVDFPTREKNDIPEFLDIENLVKLAVDHQIDAIHPGYGYLSENATFAKRCEEENILFVGPSWQVIQNMGNKLIAKEIAKKANVPMLTGSSQSIQNVEEAKVIADLIGFPIIIKASAGGGGRGMRVVFQQEELEAAYKAATNEALTAFNDDSVFIEKYVENPRHIEVQIVADQHGNVIHLGERECSIQRKQQKLIEEAPSSALSPKKREEITAAAVRLAQEANYSSLGTVEFLLDHKGDFYFMEMNTRIQVEHPITEEITKLDLVELQLNIANNKALPITQEQVQLQGWAIECRINAEDIQNNFSPSTGVIKAMTYPEGKHIRIESGIKVGSEITTFYDSMIMKLIVHGKNRKDAIKKMLEALNKLYIKGVKTTIPFHKAVLNHNDFIDGDFNTSFVQEHTDELDFVDDNEDFAGAIYVLSHYYNAYYKAPQMNPSIDYWSLNNKLK